MLVLVKWLMVMFLMCFKMCLVLIRLFRVFLGRLIWLMLFVIMVWVLKLMCVRNIFICLGVVFCVLFRMMKVLFSVCLCMKVSGVIFSILCLKVFCIFL